MAKKMIKFLEVSTIGVSKESQLRAAKILGVISDGCHAVNGSSDTINFFKYGKNLMTERWERLRKVVKRSEHFSLPKYPIQNCTFSKDLVEPHPGNLLCHMSNALIFMSKNSYCQMRKKHITSQIDNI